MKNIIWSALGCIIILGILILWFLSNQKVSTPPVIDTNIVIDPTAVKMINNSSVKVVSSTPVVYGLKNGVGNTKVDRVEGNRIFFKVSGVLQAVTVGPNTKLTKQVDVGGVIQDSPISITDVKPFQSIEVDVGTSAREAKSVKVLLE